MNEHNTAAHDIDHAQDSAAIDLGRLLTSSLPRTQLLPLVTHSVKQAIAQFLQREPISTNVVDHLRRASAIPLQPELCILMARVGFDKALFTYGHAAGTPVGYAEGTWLLKFLEPKDNEPSRPEQASWLEFLGKNATRH